VGQVCSGGACVEDGVFQPTKAGDLIVTEFMAKSQANSDPGEWFEVVNTTSGALDLAGCVLRDEGGDTHTVAASVLVAAGAHVVLARSADALLNHGLSPDYVYASFNLANTDDEILIECGGVLIDRVAYLAGQVVVGVASQLSSSMYDAAANDAAAAWCAATTPYGTAGKLGSPGAPNGSCGVPVDPCVPNPCTAAPAPACQADGLTLLSYAAPAACTNEAGVAVCGEYPSTPTDCSLTGQVCEAGACVTPIDPCTPNPCTLPPAPTCEADGLTRVTYAAEASCLPLGPLPLCGEYAATSYDCSTDELVCKDGACVAAGPSMPKAAGQVIVSEFMARSMSGADNFEWFELANTTDQSFELGGCVLTDDKTNTVTIAGSLLLAPHALLLLTRSASDTEYGRAPDYVYGTAFNLGNDGDAIILRCGGVTIDSVAYAASWVTLGKARQLSSAAFDATLNDDLANWCLATSAYNATPKLGTPGAANFDCSVR
jgi:xanthine/CO dehydrogenase XdhC/CoxF family maturation factor